MPDRYEPYAREQCLVKPNTQFVLWCPFCEGWRLTDSMVARKKMGLHITSYHPNEVRFAKGVKPPELQEYVEVKEKSNAKDHSQFKHQVTQQNSLQEIQN